MTTATRGGERSTTDDSGGGGCNSGGACGAGFVNTSSLSIFRYSFTCSLCRSVQNNNTSAPSLPACVELLVACSKRQPTVGSKVFNLATPMTVSSKVFNVAKTVLKRRKTKTWKWPLVPSTGTLSILNQLPLLSRSMNYEVNSRPLAILVPNESSLYAQETGKEKRRTPAAICHSQGLFISTVARAF